MNVRFLHACILIVVLLVSIMPSSLVYAKETYGGGNPDLRIWIDNDVTGMHLDQDEFELLLRDMENLPTLFETFILHQVKEFFIKHRDGLANQYIELLHIDCRIAEGIMYITVNGVRDTPYVTQSVEVESSSSKMSVIERLRIVVYIHGDLDSVDPNKFPLNLLLADTLRRVQILATEGEQALNKHRDEFFEGDLYGDLIEEYPAHANKAHIQLIVMNMLDDMARVSMYHPYHKNINEEAYTTDSRVIDEIETGLVVRLPVLLSPPVNYITLEKPELVSRTSGLNFPAVGSEVIVQSELKNIMPSDLAFTYIIQVKDRKGITVWLDEVEGILSGKDSIKAALGWIPESSGIYEVETFLWTDLINPVPYTTSQNIVVEVTKS